MKKVILILTLAISSINFAQQEIKIDVADALVFKTVDLSYEFYLNDQTSIGTAILYSLEEKTADFRYNEKFMISPYIRHFFTSERAWNFFGEGFFGVSSGFKKIKSDIAPNVIYESYTDGALGIGIGTKYVSDTGLVIEFHAGVGRNMFTTDSPIVAPRAGINVGWRL